MTHFLSSKPALPLSPFLIVKLWPIFTPNFVINFCHFFTVFLSIMCDFDEKLDFPIKKHTFWSIFDINFDQFLMIFHPFLGSFLGFLGGYPSPSISAPLVVKKCLKLYIYNIGPWATMSYHHTTSRPIKMITRPKCTKTTPLKNDPSLLKNRISVHKGRTRIDTNLPCVISPTRIQTKNRTQTVKLRFREGRTRVWIYSSSPVNLPVIWNKSNNINKMPVKNREGRTRVLTSYLLSCESPRRET